MTTKSKTKKSYPYLIKPKFKINDEVFFSEGTCIRLGRIENITISIYKYDKKIKKKISYDIDCGSDNNFSFRAPNQKVSEKKVFKSAESARNQIIKNIQTV